MMPNGRHVISLWPPHTICPSSMPYTYPSPLTALERTPQGHQELDRLHLWPRTGALISGLTAMGFLRHWGDVVFVTLSHPKQSPTEHCEAEPPGGAGTQYQYFTEPQSVSQLFHGPAPRRSPLHRLAVRLRHSRTLNEVCQFSQVQSSQVKSTSHLLLRRGHVGQHLTTCRL